MKNRFVLPPGLISLAVVFTSLCLTVLALLTYSEARGELALAQASASRAYMTLEGEAKCRMRVEMALEMARKGENINQIALETHGSLSDNILILTQTMDSSRSLEARMTLGPEPSLLSLRRVYVGDWTPEDGLEVWDGE